MEITFKLQDYVQHLEPLVNEPLDLKSILDPFDMHSPSFQSQFLLHGHFCDWLNSQYKKDDTIMVFDILEELSFLGFEPANQLVEKLHFMIQRQINIEELNQV